MQRLRRHRSATRPNSRPRTQGSPPQNGGFWTWPRKVIAVMVPLILAWAVPYFGPDIVQKFRAASGQDFLSVTVLTADQFRSDAHVDHTGLPVVNRPLSELKAATPREDKSIQESGQTQVQR